jgi:hypothetical protein
MNVLRFTALLGLAAVATGVCALAEEREHNVWPFTVERTDPAGRVDSWSAGGPLFFKNASPEGGTVGGFRPFWVQTKDFRGDVRSVQSLYPLFDYSADANTYRWSVFQLINRGGLKAGADPTLSPLEQREAFDVWPVWFSRRTADPDTTYAGLMPIGGTIKHHFGFDRLSWALFPLYVRSEKHGAVTTQTPWPILRVTTGAAHGFALWPLFGSEERPGVSQDKFWLWPLGYASTTQPKPDAPAGTAPARQSGMLPFYTRATGPGFIDESYAWPFFGYADRTVPYRYHETRYLWPFLVQGRGDDLYINRWGPFYTHSIIKGYDKTWFVWPFVRHAQWTDAGLVQTKTQFFYVLYLALVQRSATNPTLPAARLIHVWPFLSIWDNGAGRRQWQALSPFDALFTNGEKVRQSWTPLFAFIRFDQKAPGETRTSLLWNAVTWQRSATEARAEFHLGPLLSVATDPQSKRVALGNGLVGWQRGPLGAPWRLFWLDFPSKHVNVPALPAP